MYAYVCLFAHTAGGLAYVHTFFLLSLNMHRFKCIYIYIYNIRTPGFGSFGRFADFASLGGPRIYIYIYIRTWNARGATIIYIYIYTHIRAAGFVHFLSFGNLASLGGPRLLGGWGCVWNAHRRGPVYTNIRTAGLMAFVRLASFGGPRIYTCMECTGGDYIYIYTQISAQPFSCTL